MKTKYYTKLILPLCLFCCLFRFLQLAFAVEYSVDSYFYINGSIIPVMFNVYIGICIVFFLSYWLINFIKNGDASGIKERSAQMKAAKKAGSEAYKAYIAENKKDAVLMSEFSRMKKLDGNTTLLYVISSVLILAYAVQLFLGELERVLISYNGVGDIFKSLITYIFLTALLSVLFFVQFSASPKAAAKGKFWMIISFAPAIFYTLLVFYTFRIHSGIISKVFVTFDFLKIAAIGLALICLPQLFASSQRKNVFFSVSLCAVFLSALRLTDGVVSVLVSMGLGNGVLPVISHLDKIEIEPLLALGDFFLSVALLLTAVRVCKKTKKKVEAPTTENADAAAVTEEAAEVSDASAPTVVNEQGEVAEEEAVSEEIVAEEEPAPTEADVPQNEITVDEAPSEEEKSE